MSTRHTFSSRSKFEDGLVRSRAGAKRRTTARPGRWRAWLRPFLQELEQRILLAGPDLIISSATAPATALIGNDQTINVSWTVTNQGDAIPGGDYWNDSVYLSPTSTYDSSTAIQIDDEEHDVNLGLSDGGSYSVSDSVYVPNVPASFSLGSDYVIFMANSDGGLTESNTSNNSYVLPITLTAPNVDLAISSPTVSQSTAVAGNGQELNFAWTVSNLGTDPAAALRTDSVYLANATTLAAATESWLITSADTFDSPPLAGGANTSETATGALPNVPAGNYDLVYIVNAPGSAAYGTQSETNTANDETALPITVTRPNVDLDLQTASLSTPTTITEGSTVTVNYTVKNLGTDPADGAWTDSIYLSNTPTLGSTSNSQLLDSFSPPSTVMPLAGGASYDNSDQITIPQYALGNEYLVVVTNDGDDQAETDDPGDANDSFDIPITLTAPDLTATIVSSPATAIEGATVPITYTVTNAGSVATVTDWTDSVYLSPTPSFDSSTATLVDSFETNTFTGSGQSDVAPLAAGASYTRTEKITVPGTATGPQYLIVVADDSNLNADDYDDYPYQPDSNLANNAASAAITLSAPDLTVTTATAPSAAIEGQSIGVSWTTENIGASSAPGDWTDSIFVSALPTLDDSATFVESFNESSQSPLAANASYTQDKSIALPRSPTGNEYLIFVTNINQYGYQAQGETNYANNTFVLPITVTAPDLTITAATAPSTAILDGAVTVSWTVKNIGAVAAPGDWQDAVFLGSSPTFDAATDLFVNSFDESGQSPLAAGTTYTGTESISLPANASIGNLYLIFVTNYYAVEANSYETGSEQGETNYTNNSFALPIAVTAPDLTITTATAPTSAVLSTPFSVSWTVQNIGAVPAPGDWYDAVYIGDAPTFDGHDTFVDDFAESSRAPLAAGATYTDTESITLPSTAATGDDYLLFVTNIYGSDGDAYEISDAQGETNYTNNIFSVPITVAAPDLTVTGATAPASAVLGSSLQVSWTVENIGSVPAAGQWYDAVYVGPSPTFDASDDTFIDSYYESDHAPLAADASYTSTESISLTPQTPVGGEYLIFVTNYDAVAGYDYYDSGQGESNYTNNTFALPITVTAPDLTITTASAPSAAIEGQSISVSWTTENIGSVAAPGVWSDGIFIGASPTFDSSIDTFVTSFSESSQSPLSAGASYTQNESVYLPPAPAGSEYLIFVTNYIAVEGSDSGQGETNYSNNSYSVPIALSAPDLTITSATAPATAILNEPITVSWSVQNIGNVAAPGHWYDAVYVGPSPTFDVSTDTYVDEFLQGGQSPLAAGSSYTDTESIDLPASASTGPEYLIFVTNLLGVEGNTDYDATDAQGETNFANNTFATPIAISAPDLTVTTASAPTSASSGSAVSLSWTVENIGSVPAPGTWYDAVYIGASPTFNQSDDTFIADFSESQRSPLAAGASYTDNESITVPASAPIGDDYLIFVTNYEAVLSYGDYSDAQGETNYKNNTFAVPVTVAAPDLDLVTASAPASAIASGTIQVSWTVQNIGSIAASGDWYDAVFIGASPTFNESDDTLVTSFDEGARSPLAAGASYAVANQSITLPADVPLGDEYLIFVTNYYGVEGAYYDAVGETSFANNSFAVAITTAAPDLKVTTATAPSSATEGTSIDVSWTVQNIGSVAAPGDWYDAIFVGDSPTFDSSSDVFVQSFSESGYSPLAANASYTISNQSITLPSAATGNEYLIFVTNYYAVENDVSYYSPGQGETNYANNTFAVAITLSAPDLTVTSIAAPTPDASVGIGATIPVSWTVENVGGAATTDNWYDYVYLSTTETLGYSYDYLGEYYTGPDTPLAAGASYNASLNVEIPNYVSLGSDYLIVQTDGNQGQPESDTSNDTLAVSITVTAPDLTITAASITPTTAEAGNGNTVSLSYTVNNQGPVAANSDWYDAVYLSPGPNFDANTDTAVATFDESAQAGLAAGASYTEQETITIPNGVAGPEYLIVVTNIYGVDDDGYYYDDQTESNYTNNTEAVAITLTAAAVDLVIAQPSAPSTADVDSSIPIAFTVTNQGTETAQADWTDDVYLGSSPAYASGDRLLSSYDATDYGDSPLDAGASYTVSDNVSVPNVAPGSYYIIFVTNEGQTQSESDYSNDSTSVPITITAPDLTVTSASITNSTDGVLIQDTSYTVDWTVQNIGSVSALGYWDDALYLSSTPTYNPDSYTYLGEFYEGYNSPLAASSSYQDSETVSIPSYVTAGNQYLLVIANVSTYYGSGQSETSLANNVDAIPVYVTPPAADLTVTTATAPTAATLGQKIQVSWTVANQGTDPANGDWCDAIYVSNDPAIDSTSQLIQEFNESSNSGLSDVSGSNTYTDTETITIPSTATGARYLIFDTNVTGSQSETDPYNNTYDEPITLNSPDLVVTSVTAPPVAIAGQSIAVTWTVENEGSVATVDDWYDNIYLSTNQNIGGEMAYLGDALITTPTTPLAAGASYTMTANVTLAASEVGNLYVIVDPDDNNGQDGGQPEYGETNTIGAAPIDVSIPDPAVTAVTAPSSGTPGQSIPISWTVTNDGTAATVDDWYDQVYLTNGTGGFWDLAFVPITSPNVPLAPGASYTISENVTIPALAAGTYTLYVVIDENGGQPELTTSNDTFTQAFTITLPDPAVTTVTAPASVTPGQSIPISWTVQNDGTVPTEDDWTDKIYLSPDSTLDSKATLLASVPIGSAELPLAAGANYTISQDASIPATAPGSEFILVVTDADGGQPEVTTANDLFAQPITINPSPDLEPQSITVSASPTFGQSVTISWVDQNIGQGIALSGWSDNVYYSPDATLDASAVLLGTVSQASAVPLSAGAGATGSLSVTLPFGANTPAGTYYILVQTNASGTLLESNTSNDVGSLQTHIAVQAPDLVVSNIVNPSTGETDQPVDIDWTDSNQGDADVTNGWDDEVYASPDGQLDDAVLLGDFPEAGTLAAGSSASIVQSVTLPSTAGTYSIIVVTNANGSVNEGPNAGNDTTLSTTTIDVIAEPLADLIVTSIVPPPDGVFSGQSVPITYTVENVGDAATSVPIWHDFVILSQNPSLTFNGTYDQLLNNQPVLKYFDNPSYLGIGQSYENTVDVTLPVDAQGPWYVYVVANGLGTHYDYKLPESNRANNLLVSSAFNVQLTPAPALDVATVVAPSQAFSGQPLNVNWTVTNDGAGPTAASSWTDQVYLSPTSTFDSSTAVSLGAFYHEGALAAGASYSQSQSVTLPVGISGSYYFIVQTDALGQVFQDGDTAQNIGVETAATNVNPTPPPDLTIKAVVPKLTSVLAGHTLEIAYTVLNAGAGVTQMAAGADTAVAWTDAFYLSPTTTLNPATEIAIGTVTHSGALSAGSRYTNNITLTLPNAISGSYYLIADADVGDQVYEIDLTSKVGSSTSPITVTSMPADLIVSTFKAPSSVQAGTNVTLSWTVKNQGTGDTIATTWDDEVFASTSANLSSPVLLGTYIHKGLLNAGQSYTTSQAVPIPLSMSGTVYLFVTTNPGTVVQNQTTYAVYESNYANDSSSPATVMVAQALSDLVITHVAAPSALTTGDTYTITWTTDNDGTATTNVSSWYDDVWMSTTTDVGEGGTDIYLGSYYRSNDLAAGQSYNASATVTIPFTVASGTYYIIVRADRPSPIPGDSNSSTVNRVLESNETNNDTASSATTVNAGAAPDLTVTSVTAPAMAVEDQPISVSWTVANDGGATTASWNDAVYLSLDTRFDPLSAIYLGYAGHSGGLAAGQSYTADGSFNVPAGLSGNYYILVVANSGDSIFESNYINDIAAATSETDISLSPPVDLVAGTITIPASAVPGSSLTFSYTVTNQSANNAVGQWTDSLYLSTTNSFTYTDPLLATNVHTGGLAAGQSYTDTITATVPGVAPGTYYVILRTDVLNQIPETNTANNVSASLSNVSIAPPALTLGTETDGTLGQDQSACYEVVVTSGQTLQVNFNSQDVASLNELFVSYGTLPSQSQADYRYTSPSANQRITVPITQAGTYYILAYGSSIGSTAENYAITASLVPFAIQTVEPSTVGQGPATIEIDGSKFDNNTTFELLGPNNTVVPEGSVQLASSTTAFVRFDLTGMPLGQYTVEAIPATGSPVTLSDAVTVTAASASGLQIYASGPSASLPNSQGSLTVSYVNRGNTDVMAPLLGLTATNALLKLPDQSAFAGNSVQFLGISATGPAGVIRPGESGSVSIQFEATGEVGQAIQVEVQEADDTQPMDWASLESTLQLPSIPDAAWPTVFATFVGNVGATAGTYNKALAADDSYLSQFGEATDDVAQLLDYEIQKANATYTPSVPVTVTADSLPAPGMNLTFTQTFQPTIAGRNTLGILGYGWTTNWDISASTDSLGNAVIEDQGVSLYYVAQANGTYVDEPGDHSVLNYANGAYSLVESDGSTYQFNPDGTLAYVQDSNGHRISASYNTAGQRVELTDSNGEFLTFAYNANGTLASLTDSTGLTDSYGYDSTGDYLTSFTSSVGTTTYTYITTGTAAQDNALAEIAYSSGTHTYFSYDSQGRLIDEHLDGGADDESFAYLPAGGYTATDGDGNTSTTFLNLYGATAETVDALGNATYYTYDANLDLVEVDGPEGTQYTYTYDNKGNLTSETDPLGNTVSYTYNANDDLTSYTDAEGNTTSYAYNSANDLLSVTYANGDDEQYSYNPLGEATQFIDADGHAIGYTYNSQGLLTEESFADGSSYTFTYNSRGDMLTATDSSGTISFTYGDPSDPDLLTEVVYPDGTYLQFSYNPVGQRTQSVDQTGFTVNYLYDAAGRLSELTDASGGLIVQYTYDAAGNLTQEDMGNGTRTVYTYNAVNAVLSITNYAPDHVSVNSYDDYTYDGLGNVLTDTSQNGEWTYTYDADGQLTIATFVSTNTSVAPDQSIQYVYNAAGDRTSETVNGVTTTYVTNSVNEYTSSTTAGVTTTYQYDANGDLTSETVGGGTTTYSYNELNELTAVGGPSLTASYGYDPLGNLISETVNDATTNYQVDPTGPGDVVASYNGSGALVSHFVFGIGLTSEVTGTGSAYYYNFDITGNTTGLTNSSGQYVNQYSYLPFGVSTTISAAVANPFTFVGKSGVVTTASGLFVMKTRVYNPVTGQFLSNDRLGVYGGDANTRRYVQNSPIVMIDVLGLDGYEVNGFTSTEYFTDSGGTLTAGLGWLAEVGQTGLLNDIESTEGFNPFGGYGGLESIEESEAGLKGLGNLGEFADTLGKSFGALAVGADSLKLALDLANHKSPDDLGWDLAHLIGDLAAFDPAFWWVPLVISFLDWFIHHPQDPNNIIGPDGYGDQNFVSANQVLPYQIDFENEPTAGLPAQQVTVTQQLDPGLDWNDFRLGSFGFDGMTFNVPANSSFYQTTIDLTQTLGYEVQVAATIDELTGVATWTLTTIDPTTGEIPTDPTIGFLPPDNAAGDGEGFVSYTIMANPNDSDGTVVNAQATVVFYGQPPINTPSIFNTIGSAAPTVTLAASALDFTTDSATLTWAGQDGVNGPGIADYNVYVSNDGGAFTPFLTDTTLTQATFTGQAGDTDDFYVEAIDNTGTASAPSSIVEVLLVPPPSQPAAPTLIPADDSGIQGDGITDDASPSVSGATQDNATIDLLNNMNMVVATTTADGNGNYSLAIPGAPLSPGTYSFSVEASNVNGTSPPTAFSLTIVAPPVAPSAPSLLPADDSGTQGDGITDDSSPSLTGTASAGATVQLLSSDDTVLDTVTAGSSGSYTIPIPGPLAIGTYQYSVNTIDQYGDVSPSSDTYSLTIVAPPVTPSAPALLPADDSGTQGDGITDDSSPSLTGSAFAGASVQLLDAGNNVIANVTAGSSGAYTIPIPGPLTIGNYQYRIDTVDQYGDISAPSDPYSLTIVAPPATPSAPTLLPADDSGTRGDGITDDSRPSLTGTAFAGATVQLLSSADTVLDTVTAGSSGSYTIPIPGPLAIGTYQYSVNTIDQYGDVSPPSDTYSLTIVAPPVTPSTPALLPADDSGTQGDGITDDSSPSLTGTASAGATVQLLSSDDTVLDTVTAGSSGSYTIPIPGPLAIGTYQYSVNTIDQYGDVSPPSDTYSLTIVAPPVTPSTPALLPADDSGTQGDGITDDSSPSLTGTAFAGASVQLLDAGNNVIANVTAGSSGAYTIPIPGPLAIGNYQYRIDTVDQYGDISAPSDPYSLTIVAPPVTPSAPALLPADDSGTQGDGITDDSSPSLTGTAFAGATVQLLSSADTVLDTVTAGSSGSYTVPIPGSLAVGTYQYSVQTIDQYGDTSSPSQPFSLTIVLAPATPSAPTLLGADDSGIQGDGITDVTDPHLTGTTIPNATVQLLDSQGDTLGTVTAGATGSYTVAIPGPLTAGSYRYRIAVVDQYGDSSAPSGVFMLTVVAPPVAPSAPELLPADDTGKAGDGLTDNSSPSLTGSTFDGATVQLLNGGDEVIATTTASATGTYMFPLAGPLADGSYQYSVQTTDQYGDISSPSAPFSLTIVPVPPTPSVPTLAPGEYTESAVAGVTLDTTPHLTGTTIPNGTVQILDADGNVLTTTTANAAGAYNLIIPGPLALGTYQYRVNVLDQYDDPSADSSAFSLTVVALPATPGAPTLLASESNGSPGGETTTSTSPTLVGTVTPGATVQLLDLSGSPITSAQANSAGAYQLQVPGQLAVGTHTYSVDQIDQYGDVSAISPSQTITVVSATPPPPPPVTVTGAVVETIKVGTGKKAKKETVLVLSFSGPLTASTADNLGAYELAPVVKVPAKGKGIHRQPATTKLGTPVRLASAIYSASKDTVTLTPSGTFKLSQPDELIIQNGSVTDSLGRPIDGNYDGQPGGKYVATVSKSGVTVGGSVQVRGAGRSSSVRSAIDSLLAHGELSDLARDVRAERAVRMGE